MINISICKIAMKLEEFIAMKSEVKLKCHVCCHLGKMFQGPRCQELRTILWKVLLWFELCVVLLCTAIVKRLCILVMIWSNSVFCCIMAGYVIVFGMSLF